MTPPSRENLMSANLVVDLANTCQFHPSAITTVSAASGVVVGLPIDLKNSDTLCNLFVAVLGAGSGPIGIQVQTSDVASGNPMSGGGLPTSGSFTDPLSGLPEAAYPPSFNSGAILFLNSGLFRMPGGGGGSGQYVNGAPVGTLPFGLHPIQRGQGAGGFNTSGSWPIFSSGGGVSFASFPRPHRFARAIIQSGATTINDIMAGFVTNLKTTGSGGGFSYGPTSGMSGGVMVAV